MTLLHLKCHSLVVNHSSAPIAFCSLPMIFIMLLRDCNEVSGLVTERVLGRRAPITHLGSSRLDSHSFASHECAQAVEEVGRNDMFKENSDLVEESTVFERTTRISKHFAARIMQQDREGNALNVTPSDGIKLARSTVVDHERVGPMGGGVPGGRHHQVNHSVHGNQVRGRLPVVQHRAQDALAARQHQAGGAVDVVHPATERLAPGRGHDGRAHDGHGQAATLLRQEALGQGLRVSICVGPVADELRRDLVHEIVAHPLDRVDYLLRLHGRRVEHLVDLEAIAIGVGRRDVNERLREWSAMRCVADRVTVVVNNAGDKRQTDREEAFVSGACATICHRLRLTTR